VDHSLSPCSIDENAETRNLQGSPFVGSVPHRGIRGSYAPCGNEWTRQFVGVLGAHKVRHEQPALVPVRLKQSVVNPVEAFRHSSESQEREKSA
jgi:hypothetical protein